MSSDEDLEDGQRIEDSAVDQTLETANKSESSTREARGVSGIMPPARRAPVEQPQYPGRSEEGRRQLTSSDVVRHGSGGHPSVKGGRSVPFPAGDGSDEEGRGSQSTPSTTTSGPLESRGSYSGGPSGISGGFSS